MPITTSAKKALRKDKKKTQINRVVRTKLKTVLDAFKSGSKKIKIEEAYSTIDRAAKRNVIHKNKAARLKSKISEINKTA